MELYETAVFSPIYCILLAKIRLSQLCKGVGGADKPSGSSSIFSVTILRNPQLSLATAAAINMTLSLYWFAFLVKTF